MWNVLSIKKEIKQRTIHIHPSTVTTTSQISIRFSQTGLPELNVQCWHKVRDAPVCGTSHVCKLHPRYCTNTFLPFKETREINLGRKVNYTEIPIQRLQFWLLISRVYDTKLEKQSYSPEYYFRTGKEIACQDSFPSHGGYHWPCKPTGGLQWKVD